MRDFYSRGYQSKFRSLLGTHWLCAPSADHGLASIGVQKIINSVDLHFDLVINEEMFIESWLMFGHKFNAPTMTISGCILASILCLSLEAVESSAKK